MEEVEAVKRPLMVKEKLGNNGGQSSGNYNRALLPSTTVTFAVGLSICLFYIGSYAAGNTIAFSSPAESGILRDLGLTLAEYAIFVSMYLGGSIVGALWTGKIADGIGRRSAMGVTNLFCATGWFAIALSKDALWLHVGRFFIGFGMGLGSYGGPIYMAEIIPKNIRGAVFSMMPLLLSCGRALFFVIGPLVSWRTLALIGLVPYPFLLMKTGKAEECEKALRRIRGAEADISQENADIKDYTEHSKRVSGDGILKLFQRTYTRCLIIGLGLAVFQQFGGASGIVFYTSSIFESAGFSGRIGSMAVGTTQILMALLGVCFIDKFGRRPLLLISAAGTCLGSVLIGMSFLFQSLHFGDQPSPILSLAGVLVYLGFHSLGMEGIPLILWSEIFPVNIKGAAGSIVNVVCLGSGWVVSITFNSMFQWNSAGTFFIFAGICSANLLFIWKMVPETKGRSLEEIQASIAQHSPN